MRLRELPHQKGGGWGVKGGGSIQGVAFDFATAAAAAEVGSLSEPLTILQETTCVKSRL